MVGDAVCYRLLERWEHSLAAERSSGVIPEHWPRRVSIRRGLRDPSACAIRAPQAVAGFLVAIDLASEQPWETEVLLQPESSVVEAELPDGPCRSHAWLCTELAVHPPNATWRYATGLPDGLRACVLVHA